MKQLFLIPVLVLLLASILTAQEEAEKRADALYFEGFGNNLYYGLFYDTRFNKSPKGFGGAIGFGAYQNVKNELDWVDNDFGGSLQGRTINSIIMGLL